MSDFLSLSAASSVIKEGGVLAYATETFFALGCSALDAKAMGGVFAAKRRPATMPLPVIVGDVEQLSMLTSGISEQEQELMDCFWPDSLSILFKAAPWVPVILTGGTGMVAVRLSPHEGARNLARAAGVPLVSTSANISGRGAVTCAKALDIDLLSAIKGVYDALPKPAGGLPSSLVLCQPSGEVRLLREGGVSREALHHAGFCVEQDSM